MPKENYLLGLACMCWVFILLYKEVFNTSMCVCVCVCVASGYAHKLNSTNSYCIDCHVHLYFGVWPVIMENDVIKCELVNSRHLSSRGNGLGTRVS